MRPINKDFEVNLQYMQAMQVRDTSDKGQTGVRHIHEHKQRNILPHPTKDERVICVKDNYQFTTSMIE